MNRIKIVSEKAKRNLSLEKQTNIFINEFYNNELLNIKITRENLDKICNDLFNQLIDPVFKVLNDGKKNIQNISEIVFVGGSTRIPSIKQLILNFFPDVNINDSINPDETVAYGAAIQAAILKNGNDEILNDIILFDITPFSLGVDVRNPNENSNNKNKGHIMSTIIPKGSRIPVENNQYYTSVVDNQEIMTINVYEGENKYAKDNQLLGTFKLVDLPQKPKGEIKVNVNFNIDENGILTVTAFELSQKIKRYIKIINDKIFDKNNAIEEKEYDLIFENEKKTINYKESMKFYYKRFNESKNIEDKYNNLYEYSNYIFKLLNNFEKKGNDCLGNKYFCYTKMLFKACKILIHLNTEKAKDIIIRNSQLMLSVLAEFNNIDYNNYSELLKYFVYETPKDENEIYEGQKIKPDLINFILFSLVIFVMGLLEKKAKTILYNKNLKFSRYNSRYIFDSCIRINEQFIQSESEISRYSGLREEYNRIIKSCKEQIKKINANSLVEIDKSKESAKLFENTKKMKREELLILLDNYRESFQMLENINDYESKAIILANIVKINYKYLNNKDYSKSKKMAKESIDFADQIRDKNIKTCEWYSEINQLFEELKKKAEEIEKKEGEKLKEENKDDLDELENFQYENADDIIEFIEHILEKYPLKKNPLKYKTVKENLEKEAKSLIEKLSSQYSTKRLKTINTKEEKLKFEIYKIISLKLNSILLKVNQNEIKFSK